MILNVSGRTDIVAFYSDWFFKRLKEGYADVRNPFCPSNVTRVILSKETIDAIVYCTKNPIPLLKYTKELKQYPTLLQVTITPYGKEIEPFVPPKGNIIKTVKELSKTIDPKYIYVRYDPIFLSNKYHIFYHIQKFEELLDKLEGSISRVIISFLDEKKNTVLHQKEIGYQMPSKQKIEFIASSFAEIAKKHNVEICTCAEEFDFSKYGFLKEGCIDPTTIWKLTGKTKFKKGSLRKNCLCLKTVDIGSYNSCPHKCLYCYANYDEKKICENYKNHDSNSSLLIGKLKKEEIVKVKK